jgi:hypothetical protein
LKTFINKYENILINILQKLLKQQNKQIEKNKKTEEIVNTKNWYKEKTDLWTEFGKRAPFGKRFSSKHSAKTPAVGSTSSFDRRAVSRLEEEAVGAEYGLDTNQ